MSFCRDRGRSIGFEGYLFGPGRFGIEFVSLYLLVIFDILEGEAFIFGKLLMEFFLEYWITFESSNS